MVYHSSFNSLSDVQHACDCPILPLKLAKAGTRGPAPKQTEGDDIIDEALSLFRANVLFRHFEIQGPADRLLVYLTLYISHLLRRFTDAIQPVPLKADARKLLVSVASESFALPGDPGFVLGSFCAPPKNNEERELIRQYLKQARDELGYRLIDKCYREDDGTFNKFWMAFAKRKFMNKTL